MTSRFAFAVLALVAIVQLAACTRPSGKPAPGPEVPRPDSILDPVVLYNQNCAGCHGADGRKGPAIDLSDPVYLAIVDDDTLRSTISKGRPGTAMSAFAQKEGGMLTDEQVSAIIRGIRERWGKPNALAGVAIPSYSAKEQGNSQQGQEVYATYCASCHGSGDKAGPKAGSVTNPSYLSLISDQGLRTIVIAGRPDFGAPDWRGNVPGRPMSEQEITDVVAWLAAQRPKQSTQSANSSSPEGIQ